MRFELDDDQEALREAARDLLDGYADPARVRATVDAGGGVDAELWRAMVEQGWTGLTVPEDRGGLGFGMVEAAVLLEQVGAHVAPAPFLSQMVALDALASAARGDEVDGWVERLVAGESRVAVAFRPVSASGDELTGRTEPVLYAPSADAVLVCSEEALFLVPSPDPPPPPESAMDLTREVGWLDLAGSTALRLGDADAVTRHLDVGATAYAAEMLGGAAHALDLAVAYAKEREQFGRPIGSFQAIKHRCADMLVDIEGMRSCVYWAAWAIAADDPERSTAASTAKIWCSDASERVMASALQVHGGIGFTWEHDIHLFLKRAQLDQLSFGDAAYHRERLAGLLRERVEAGESVL